jgi:ankyrin repeat protein
MECLFDADKPHFATWLWIYNEDRGHSWVTMRPEKPETVPLYHAAMFGLRDLAEHLITEHPEHVNARGGKQDTPIHVAACAGHVNIISLLIKHGADMEARWRSGNDGTPLHRAAWRGRLELGQCLLDHGAYINARDRGHDTPLIHALLARHVEFARMLLERGAVIDAQDNRGKTALHFAIRSGYTQAVQLLLEHGADVNVCDNEGQTASQFTAQQEIVELLSKYGAKSV